MTDNILPDKEFKYWLTYENKRIEIIAPQDWDSDSIGNFKRDEKYFGLMRTFGLEQKFVLDAYQIIRNAYVKYGYEAEVRYECEQLNRTTFKYENIFTTDVDFSQWRDDSIRCVATLMEFGVAATIKAKEGIKYEYALTGDDVVNIIIPGVVFSEKGDFIAITPIENYSNDYAPQVQLVNNDTNSGFLTLRNTQNEEDINPYTSGSWFAGANRALSVNIKGRFTGGASKLPLQNATSFDVKIINNSGATRIQIGTVDALNNGITPFDFSIDENINLANGEKLFLYVTKTNAQPGTNLNYLKLTSETEFSISYTSTSNPSNCKGIKAFDLFKRIIRRIASTQKADSFMLNRNWGNLIITCGNAIRELNNAEIQTSLTEFFETFNGLESAGMGVDMDILRLETRPYFYRPFLIAKLEGVKACEFSVAVDMVFNSLEIGYNDGNTDDLDGQYEFNSMQEYAMPISRIQRKENWVSAYRADQYGIEKLRVDFVKKTNDTSSDNDVFMFDCYFDGNYRPILGSDYLNVTGMGSDQANESVYNLRLSPKENLLRHSSYLASIFDKYPARYIDLASAEKNKDLSYTIAGNPNRTIKQSDPVLIGSFDDKYFKPTLATLTAKLPRGIMQTMSSTPFGYLQWSWQGKDYKGYIVDFGIDLAKNSERQVTLLLTSDNPI